MNKEHIPNTPHQNTRNVLYVCAPVIAKTFGVTSRYILQLAAEERIPCLRLGKKCVRFDPTAVRAAIESM